MTKKFTEKEYQKIVKIADNQIKEHNKSVVTATSSFLEIIRRECQKIIDYDKLWDLEQEFIIICLPKYRDWAHEKFVDEEKKYYWKSKKKDKEGLFKTIVEHNLGYPTDSYYINANPCAFTESEIREWGYNPDMFDKEEAE
ncbi:hypothetical protein R55227_BLOPHJLP_01639 [Fructobacillus tropaeoli]|nr:hypothetical protein R55227_BLOPHJLP_01639 [Fructobacillus tropaeoli]